MAGVEGAGQRGWGCSTSPTALFLVVSLTCEAPPRDPNQCELVDRPRYRKGPHICFDYNATVRGMWGSRGGAELGLAPGGDRGSGYPLVWGTEPWGELPCGKFGQWEWSHGEMPGEQS